MTGLVRWEPVPELVNLRQAMDRLFEEPWSLSSRMLQPMAEMPVPAVDMYQTKDAVIAKVALPGVKEDDVEVNITADGLTVKGERTYDDKVEREDYYYQEHRYGSFARYIALPQGLKIDKAEASFEDGVMTITVPRTGEVKPKTVQVKKKASAPSKTVKAEPAAKAKVEAPKKEAK
jgi:HSP20 family protein